MNCALLAFSTAFDAPDALMTRRPAHGRAAPVGRTLRSVRRVSAGRRKCDRRAADRIDVLCAARSSTSRSTRPQR